MNDTDAHDARDPDAAADLHVVFGTGPVGCWTARALVADGHRVRALTRSGHRPALLPAGVEVRAVDASDPVQARAAAEGATTVVQALNPPYHRWHVLFPPLQAAVLAAHERGGVRATVLRSADYYGPGVTGSAWGARVFAPLVAGKAAQVTGRLDVPHSVA